MACLVISNEQQPWHLETSDSVPSLHLHHAVADIFKYTMLDHIQSLYHYFDKQVP